MIIYIENLMFYIKNIFLKTAIKYLIQSRVAIV